MTTDSLDEYLAVDWGEPLDGAAYVEATPPHVTVKGMFIQRLVDDLMGAGLGVESPRYRAFKDYPMRELMRIELVAATALHPDAPIRQALREFGWTSFPTLMSSMIGRVIFAPIGKNLASAIRLAAKGYKVSSNEGRVEVRDAGRPRALLVSLGNMYNFADSFQIGVFEGAVRWYGYEPEITVRKHSPSDVDLLVSWS